MTNLTLNHRINNRSHNSAVEKVKGKGGNGFSCGVYGKTLAEVLKNGGSNLFAFHRTENVPPKDIYQNTPLHRNGYKK